VIPNKAEQTRQNLGNLIATGAPLCCQGVALSGFGLRVCKVSGCNNQGFGFQVQLSGLWVYVLFSGGQIRGVFPVSGFGLRL